jgi:predicted MFS family arabinose efflux permease
MAAPRPPLPRLWTRDFSLLTLINFAMFCSFYILLPVIPLYATELGAPEAVVGLVMAAFSLTGLVTRIWAGQAVDRGGRRALFLGTLVLFAASAGAYAWVPTVAWLVALRLLHGVSWGILTTSGATFAADLIPPPRRGEGMGYYGMAINLAMTVGPALGLFVMHSLGFRPSFLAAALVGGAALTLGTALHVPPPNGGPAPRGNHGWRRWIEPRALSLGLLMLLAGVVYSSVITFVPLYARDRGLGDPTLFFVLFAAFTIAARALSGRVFDRRGPLPVVLPGLALFTLAVVLLGLWATRPVLLGAAACLGLGFGSFQPAVAAMVINRVDPRRRGAGSATLISSFDLGIGGGSLALGGVAQAWGYRSMYLAAALAGVAALLWFLGRVWQEERAYRR